MATPKSKRTTGPKPTPKKAGVTTTAKTILIECSLDISVDDLCARLTKQGYTVSKSSITTLFGDFKQSVRVLDSMGKLKGMSTTYMHRVTAPKVEKKPKAKAPKKKKKAKTAEPKQEATAPEVKADEAA